VTPTETPSPWLAFHFFHHQDRDLLLRELVFPLVLEAFDAQALRRFFFLRYHLGGPHIRLRLELPPNASPAMEAKLEAMVARRSEEFFARFPSLQARPVEEVERITKMLVTSDPNETDERIFPDNHWQRFEFRPEVARYGGPELLPLSFDLFMASSLEAGALLLEDKAASEGQLYTRKLALLAGFAAALSDTREELAQLLDYGRRFWPPLAVANEKAKLRFAAGAAPYLAIWHHGLKMANGSPVKRHTLHCAGCLRQALAEAERYHIVASHVHMMANRLGFDNANEVFGLGLLACAQSAAGGDLSLPPLDGLRKKDLALADSSALALDSLRQAL